MAWKNIALPLNLLFLALKLPYFHFIGFTVFEVFNPSFDLSAIITRIAYEKWSR